MKKLSIYMLFLLAVTLMAFRCEDAVIHSVAKISNNSNSYIVATVNFVTKITPSSIDLNVSTSKMSSTGTSRYAPKTQGAFDLAPWSFEKYASPSSSDKVRFYFIDKELFESKGGRLHDLAPDDFIAYVDLTYAQAESMNWTIRFPEDVIFKDESAE